MKYRIGLIVALFGIMLLGTSTTVLAQDDRMTEEQAGLAWKARFPEALAREGSCRMRPPGDTTAFPDCANATGDLCLLALPLCAGVCPRFARRQDT